MAEDYSIEDISENKEILDKKDNWSYEDIKKGVDSAGFTSESLDKAVEILCGEFPEEGVDIDQKEKIIKVAANLHYLEFIDDEKKKNKKRKEIYQTYRGYKQDNALSLGEASKYIGRGILNFVRGFSGNFQSKASAPFVIPTKIRRLISGPSKLESRLFCPVDMKTGEREEFSFIEANSKIDCLDSYSEIIEHSDSKLYKMGGYLGWFAGLAVGMVGYMAIPFLPLAKAEGVKDYGWITAIWGATNVISGAYEIRRGIKKERENFFEKNKI